MSSCAFRDCGDPNCRLCALARMPQPPKPVGKAADGLRDDANASPAGTEAEIERYAEATVSSWAAPMNDAVRKYLELDKLLRCEAVITAGMALEGLEFTGIDKEKDYALDIAPRRIRAHSPLTGAPLAEVAR